MRFTSDYKLLIDDVYLCNFMYHIASEDFMIACETMIKNVCMLYEQNNQSHKRDDDILSQKLNIFKQELLDSMCKQKIDTSDLVSSIKMLNEHQTLSLQNKMEEIPQLGLRLVDLSNRVDSMKDKIDLKTNESLVYAMNTVSEQISTMSNKVDSFSVMRNTTRYKGEEGEKGLYEVLSNKLSMRDGYSILNTKSIAHSCDMVIQRVGYPDVRIESKAYGRDSGANVNTSEVIKFESDLVHLNNHGIFVSIYTGICGKGTIEFEFIPTIKKFAFYLSRNKYDGDIITEILRLIYKLDTFINEDEDVFTISNDSITKIKNHLTDFNRKIDDLKTNSKNSLRILNELTLDVIGKLLTNANANDEKTQLECTICKCVYKSKSGLTNHMKKCSQITS